MDTCMVPCNRGPNCSVTFDLAEFTQRLFATLGSRVLFTGPGPASADWHSSTTSPRERFAIDHLANELFTKFDDGVKTPEKRERAISRFMMSEVTCALTNQKFEPLASGQPPLWLDDRSDDLPDEREVIMLARKHISRVLGRFPGWEALMDGMDFGPGATTRLSRKKSDRSNKWGGAPHVALFSSKPLDVIFDAYPLLSRRLQGSGYEIVAGNNLDWVPKNYKTDRTIAIEPEWNMYLQKGIGAWFRKRLKRVSQNLDDQGVNNFLAAVGSIDGSLATLDLSMASDTVSYRLVETLIRPDWFEALEQCRSPVGSFVDEEANNVTVIYEKFSSMGNGYTFELESLIFWGLLRAVAELVDEPDRRLYVYGDDIIVPANLAGYAMHYLKACGFVVNPDKSFSSGPFRESCGGHYFKGHDVTPFYVREPVNTLDRLFLLHNNVYRWLNRHPGICSPEGARDLLQWVRSFAPETWQQPRLLTEGVGDGAFIGAFDEVRPEPIGRTKRYRGWEGWRSETLQYRPKRVQPGNAVKRNSRDPANSLLDVDGYGALCRAQYIFPSGSGPDLASLHVLDRRDGVRENFSGAEGGFVAQYLARHVYRDQEPKKGDPLPDTERYWYTGVQVLPWKVGGSWWDCCT